MITREDLTANFSKVIDDEGSGIFRFFDITPRFRYFYYMKLGSGREDDLLMVSQDREDAQFAMAVLEFIHIAKPFSGIAMLGIPDNGYGLSNTLLARCDYHSFLKGRISGCTRESVVFAVPIHRCEFAGNESREEFTFLRQSIVPILDWAREPAPKCKLRFFNPKTGGGTTGEGTLCKTDLVMNELHRLLGVENGFMEIVNYKGLILEVLSTRSGTFEVIRDRDDSRHERFEVEQVADNIRRFLRS